MRPSSNGANEDGRAAVVHAADSARRGTVDSRIGSHGETPRTRHSRSSLRCGGGASRRPDAGLDARRFRRGTDDGRSRGQRVRPKSPDPRLRLGNDTPPRRRPHAPPLPARCRRQGARDRAGREVHGVDVQRTRAGPGDPLPRRRRTPDPLRQCVVASAHRPLPRNPSRRRGRGPRDRRRRDRRRRGLHVLVHCRAIRLAPVPLSRLAARGAHLERPVRRLHRRSEGRPPAGRRARDDAERVRSELRRRQRGLRRQHGRVPLPLPAGAGEARRSRADLPAEHGRAGSDQLVPHPRELFHRFPTGTSLEPAEYTDTLLQGQGQRDILELRFPYTGKYMFHAHKTEFASLGWMGMFEVVE
jgi:hypothetical protein